MVIPGKWPSLGFNIEDEKMILDSAYYEKKILTDVVDELCRATDRFGTFASPHEGYAIIKEELDELWAEVKNNHGRDAKYGRKEAVQVAAMALRYVRDLCP